MANNPQYTGAPVPQANQIQPVADLTTGMKVAWLYIGFRWNLIGLILAYATSAGLSQIARSSQIKFAAIGWVVSFVLAIIVSVVFFVFFGSIIAAILGSIPYLDLSF